MNNRLFKMGVAFIILAGLSWLIGNLFGGVSGEAGSLYDTIFLPLTFMWALLGVIFLFLSFGIKRG